MHDCVARDLYKVFHVIHAAFEALHSSHQQPCELSHQQPPSASPLILRGVANRLSTSFVFFGQEPNFPPVKPKLKSGPRQILAGRFAESFLVNPRAWQLLVARCLPQASHGSHMLSCWPSATLGRFRENDVLQAGIAAVSLGVCNSRL